MEKKLKKSQAISIGLTATALLLFVASAFQYRDQDFFRLLLFTRILMVVVGYGLTIGLLLNRFKSQKIETFYFLFCLLMQAFHGIIEGPQSLAFYSFTGVWHMLCSLSVRQSFKDWLKGGFPVQLLGFLVPIFLKDPKYTVSVGAFVDNFSLPVSGLVIGFILAKITSDRFQALNENLILEKKLNDALSNNLNREIEIRTIVENELFHAKKEIEKSAELRATSELAAQVSHDIRSPLSALNMILGQLDTLPEQSRILVRSSVNRISDIANSLLNHNKKTSSDSAFLNTQAENTMLSSLIESVVSEKRIEFRSRSKIEVQASLENSYGLFSMINPVEMKRLLSNAINNAAEAFDERGGLIEILLNTSAEKVILTVRDNGKGIPKAVLEKLGHQGVTHGKEGTHSGSGLGVYHAKRTIEHFGGHYEIQSTIGQGTAVKMTLKREIPPNWFVQKLHLREGQTIVALDDDNSVLEIWRQRLLVLKSDINLVTCTSSECLKNWVSNNAGIVNRALYLIDYELLGQKKNGLDLVEELGLKNDTILVSSRYEEASIKERCIRMDVPMIPKGMASLVPIVLERKKLKLDCVLIDDDVELIHPSWKLAAETKKKNILCFADESSFLVTSTDLDFSTPIYVDVNLKHGVRGQDVASRIYKMGFTNVSLATGYADSIERARFLTSVVGKDFPL